MADNPFLERQPTATRVVAPSDPAERQRFWIERGNRILWGQEPNSKGEWPTPRYDLEWACSNGSYFLRQRQAEPASARDQIDRKRLASGDFD